MAKIQHLNNAPVIEAILGFQADASKAWDVEAVRSGLADHFPDFTGVQEQRMFENQILLGPGKAPETRTTVHPVEALILRKADQTAAVQIRRDGFAFSQLQPYPDWDAFVASALAQWKVFGDWLEVDAPFNTFIRFINRVSYPLDGFKLADYFESPPLPPSGTDWAFQFFRDHHIHAPKGGRFLVDSVFSTAGLSDSGKAVDFLLDITISPSQSLAETGDSLDGLLPEMRKLKNDAYFSKFTEAGLDPYR